MIAVILGICALAVAGTSAIVAHRRLQGLDRRMTAAVQETDRRIAAAVSESADRIEAGVRAIVADSRVAQLEAEQVTLAEWSTEVIAEIGELLDNLRATMKTETAGLLGQALALYEDRREDDEGDSPGSG